MKSKLSKLQNFDLNQGTVSNFRRIDWVHISKPNTVKSVFALTHNISSAVNNLSLPVPQRGHTVQRMKGALWPVPDVAKNPSLNVIGDLSKIAKFSGFKPMDYCQSKVENVISGGTRIKSGIICKCCTF